MKHVIIVHGWGGNPDEPALQWLKGKLEEKGVSVTVPAMPDTDEPKIKPWVAKLTAVTAPGPDTVFVGHSIGCQAVLRYLQTLPETRQVAGVVLLAPWMELDEETIKEEGPESEVIARPWMETPIDFAKIKKQVGKTVAIFSDDDPFVPLSQKELFEKKLGAETIVEHGRGHFSQGEGVTELPEVMDALKNLNP